MTIFDEKKFKFNRHANEIFISNDKLVHKNPTVGIIGEVKNNGKSHWYSVDLKAKLIDEKGDVVDILSNTVYQLRPGETKNFKFTSCCSENKQPISFDKYELIVEDAVLNRW